MKKTMLWVRAIMISIVGGLLALGSFIHMTMLVYALYGSEIYARWGELGMTMETILAAVWWAPMMVGIMVCTYKIGCRFDQQLAEIYEEETQA